MTSIPVGICRIFGNYLKLHYLKNKIPFLEFWLDFSSLHSIENILKKKIVSWPNNFQTYSLRKMWLLKRLKGLDSEHHSVINVLTSSKHCGNWDGITINPFLHEFEVNWVGKSLLESDLKSWDCLLTEWLPMTRIPVGTCRTSRNNSKRHYLKNKRLFLHFLLHFWNVHQFENILKKKMSILA